MLMLRKFKKIQQNFESGLYARERRGGSVITNETAPGLLSARERPGAASESDFDKRPN
jgi:hypothetical protein